MKTARHLPKLLRWAATLACVVCFAWMGRTAPAQESGSSAPRERLLAVGKELFVQRCASCHNERSDKPLSSGLPLDQRKLSREQIERAVNGRFRKENDAQRRAVVLYIESLLKK
jgi:mono/diheme cytochrome c family protein